METITISKEGLGILVNRTSGMTPEYRSKLVDLFFEAQKSITDGKLDFVD